MGKYQHLHFNPKTNKINLDSNYVFAYSKSDGFTCRLLQGEVLIDFNYNFYMKISIFHHDNFPNSNKKNHEIKGKLDGELLKLFENFIYSDYLNLNEFYDYENFMVSSTERHQILVNLEKDTTKVSLYMNLKCFSIDSDEKKHLINLINYMNNWIESIYENWNI
ncbi:hypothetical protein [Aureivirga marina]|uniref:hypothetical protein n=1 Tax=Aureivirga marina TaxID=1182451 RepID=UPI0018C9AA0B|nr:hypothetical protein [Aureivirga marina]